MESVIARILSTAVAIAVVAVSASACTTEESCAVSGYGGCGGGGFQCTDFQPGTDMRRTDFGGALPIKGQIQAFAQACGDLAVLSGNALSTVTGACKNIAVDLGDDPENAAAQGKTGSDLTTFWCDDAVLRINEALTATGTGKGLLSLGVEPPRCSISLPGVQECQADCAPGAACDFKATPPTCSGGALDIACFGDCNVPAASASIDCAGDCTGTCAGSCIGNAIAPVHCNGSCDGLCTALAAPDTGAGTGRQLDGTCRGQCSGTCTLDPGARVSCGGRCDGTCDQACIRAARQSSVVCSGTCSAEYEVVSCNGGMLSGGCNVDAKCQSNCDTSAQADATCTPAVAAVVGIGSPLPGSEPTFAALVGTLRANLPALLSVIQGEGGAVLADFAAMTDGASTIAASNELDWRSTGCLEAMVAAEASAYASFSVVLTAATKVSVAVGGPGT